MAIVVVSYLYSMSSDRALTEQATWKGRVPGRSLATVMSELRRQHREATNISITDIEWQDEGERAQRALERRGDDRGAGRAAPRLAM